MSELNGISFLSENNDVLKKNSPELKPEIIGEVFPATVQEKITLTEPDDFEEKFLDFEQARNTAKTANKEVSSELRENILSEHPSTSATSQETTASEIQIPVPETEKQKTDMPANHTGVKADLSPSLENTTQAVENYLNVCQDQNATAEEQNEAREKLVKLQNFARENVNNGTWTVQDAGNIIVLANNDKYVRTQYIASDKKNDNEDLTRYVYISAMKNKTQQMDFAENIASAGKKLAREINDNYANYAVETKNDAMLKAMSRGVSKFDVDDQSYVFQSIHKASEHFDGQIKSDIQKTLVNEIKNCDPKAQTEIVKMAAQSEDKEFAQKAVEAYCDNKKIPDDLKKEIIHTVIPELANPMSAGEMLQERFADGRLTNEEIQELAPAERSEYYLQLYNSASIEKKFEMLFSEHISSGTRRRILTSLPTNEKKQFYKFMFENSPSEFEKYIEEDATVAKQAYELMSNNKDITKCILAIVKQKSPSDGQFKAQFKDIIDKAYSEDDIARLNLARERHLKTFKSVA